MSYTDSTKSEFFAQSVASPASWEELPFDAAVVSTDRRLGLAKGAVKLMAPHYFQKAALVTNVEPSGRYSVRVSGHARLSKCDRGGEAHTGAGSGHERDLA